VAIVKKTDSQKAKANVRRLAKMFNTVIKAKLDQLSTMDDDFNGYDDSYKLYEYLGSDLEDMSVLDMLTHPNLEELANEMEETYSMLVPMFQPCLLFALVGRLQFLGNFIDENTTATNCTTL
jgi:hypothetical protein